jgi:lipid-A-disaccharide synthase
MKFYLIAGEDSGELHGANLVEAMKKIAATHAQKVDFRGVGGDKMQKEGVELIAHVRDINFMGFWEVIKNIFTIRKLFQTVENDILAWKPDAVILIDYPGFNLRLAKFLHKNGIKVFYYVSPQLWAWKKGRVKQIKQYVTKMFVILPFEKEFYKKEGLDVHFVGHPLLDAIASFKNTSSLPQHKVWGDKKVLALLPGSRTQEIKQMLPIMLQMIHQFPDYQFIIAGAPSKTEDFYQKIIQENGFEDRVILWKNRTYELLSQADLALVTSGTATLETALFEVPEIVCYKGSPISFWIGKRLVDVKYISLVNLILDKEVVKELIQHDFTAENLSKEIKKLEIKSNKMQLLKDYKELKEKLGEVGASERCAKGIFEKLATDLTD